MDNNKNQFDKETIKRMRNEDLWIGNLSYPDFMFMVHEFETMGNIEMCIELAELESVDYNQSPALHCFLAQLHKKSQTELSVEFKEKIEQLKLQRTGKQYLWDYMHMDGPQIQEYLISQGKQDFGVGPATDYLESRNISAYIHSNNFLRAHRHLSESIDLSKTNPTVFSKIIEPEVKMHTLPWILDGVLSQVPKRNFLKIPINEFSHFSDGSHTVMGAMVDNLKNTKERLEKYATEQEFLSKLKHLEQTAYSD